MNFVYQCKVVGLTYHKVENAVEQGQYMVLVENPENPIDSDSIEAYNSEGELVGYIANSDRSLSPNNRKNGNLSATELKGELDFTNRRYYAEAVRVYDSCIYLGVKENDWAYINPVEEVSEPTFVKAIDLVKTNAEESIDEANEIDTLKSEIIELKSMVAELLAEVKSLKSNEGDNSLSTSDRMLLSVVGLSHFPGQNHMGGNLSIVEEPIFEGAKGTALYLKSGDYRVGVFPSEKKKEYCEEHKIPYYENKLLKNKKFGSDIRIEELVYDEYAIISV